MAVSYDAVSSTAQTNQSTLSWTHDVGDIENGVLVIAVCEAGTTDNLEDSDVPTVNSVACEPLHFSGTTDGFKLSVWYYLNPPTDTTVTIAMPAGASMQYARGIAISLAGVDQDTPVGDSDAGNGSASPASSSLAIDSAVDNLVVDFIVQSSHDARQMVAGSGQTNRANVVDGVVGPEGRLQASTEPGYTSVTMSWANSSGNVSYRHFAASFNASAAGPIISSATPSGTIETHNTATVGCTTDTEEGTLYAVLSETNNVSTATGSQIKAGQNSTSAAADFADDAAVADSTPEVEFSGLDPETTYYYALVQETTEGFSNVLSGSFTTAAVPISSAYIRETLIDKLGDPVASVTGITMAVYHAVPTEAAPNPHEVIEDVATDSAGEIEVEIDLGELEEGDPVWIALFKDGGTPAGTLKKVTPEYE